MTFSPERISMTVLLRPARCRIAQSTLAVCGKTSES
jgi:hypothetical protein